MSDVPHSTVSPPIMTSRGHRKAEQIFDSNAVDVDDPSTPRHLSRCSISRTDKTNAPRISGLAPPQLYENKSSSLRKSIVNRALNMTRRSRPKEANDEFDMQHQLRFEGNGSKDPEQSSPTGEDFISTSQNASLLALPAVQRLGSSDQVIGQATSTRSAWSRSTDYGNETHALAENSKYDTTETEGMLVKSVAAMTLERNQQATIDQHSIASDGNTSCSSGQPLSGRSTNSGLSSISSHTNQTQHSNFTSRLNLTTNKRASEDDSDEDKKSVTAKKANTSNTSPLLACPFYAAQPYHHKSCSTARLTTIASLKQHLYRRHARPVYHCRNCLRAFKEDSGLQMHLLVGSCSEADTDIYADKMSVATEKKIKKRELRGKTDKEKWEAIFRILFPKSLISMPSSPYQVELCPVKDMLRELQETGQTQALSILMAGEGLQPCTRSLICTAMEELQTEPQSTFNLDNSLVNSTMSSAFASNNVQYG